MTATHSPGPWHRNIKPATKYNTVWSGRNKHVLRMVVDGMSPEEVEANICLATAAPDLLEALTRIVRQHDAYMASVPHLAEAMRSDPLGAAVETARAALARATGEQQ